MQRSAIGPIVKGRTTDLPDVNVLLYAMYRRQPDGGAAERWLESALLNGSECGMSELVLSGVLRIATMPGLPISAVDISAVRRFVADLHAHPNVAIIRPGPHHWRIFTGLCALPGITGNRVPDAYHAALAIESGCTWVTADAGFQRFPGLKLRMLA